MQRDNFDSTIDQSLSIIQGEAINFANILPRNLAAVLHETAKNFPEHGIRLLAGAPTIEKFISYASLKKQAEKNIHALKKLGLPPKQPILFQLDSNELFFSAFWTCILGGFVPVPLAIPPIYDKNNAQTKQLINIWLMLKKPLLLTSTKLKPKIDNIFRKFAHENCTIVSDEELSVDANDRNDNNNDIVTAPQYDADLNEVALLLPTSGSTGSPKIVQQTHFSLLTQILSNVAMHNFSCRDISLNWVPLDHVGSLIMSHLRDVYLGAQQIHTDAALFLENPSNLLNWIDKFHITTTWAPNFAFALVNDCAETITKGKWNLSSLRMIFNGGEAIVANTARKFIDLLTPHKLSMHAMCPAWGMSETCSGTVFSHNFKLVNTKNQDPNVVVGKPLPGFAVRIVTDQNEQQKTAEGVSGALQVKGQQLTIGYYDSPKLNAEIFTKDGWFKTGDLGVIKNGQLTILGRDKNTIIINGVNYYGHEIEATIDALDEVETSYTAACSVRRSNDDTDHLAIFLTPKTNDFNSANALLHKVYQSVIDIFGIPPSFIIPLKKEDIPKTSIGKIQHAVLKNQFAADQFTAILEKFASLTFRTNEASGIAEPLKTDTEKYIAEIWEEIFTQPNITINLNFFTLGGNSLKGMQLIAKLNSKFKIALTMQDFLSIEPNIISLAQLIEEQLKTSKNHSLSINIEQF